MSVAEEIEAIVAIEQTFDVNSVAYRGIKVWPLIRIHIDYCFYQLANNPNIDLSHPRPMRQANPVGLKFSQIQGEYLKQSQAWREILTPFSFLDRTDILFFSRHENHSEKIGGKFVDRFLDPMQELCQANWNTLKLELDFPQGRKKQPRWDPSIFVSPYPCLVKENLLRKCLESSPSSSFSTIHNFSELQTTVKNYTGFHLDEAQLIEQVHLLDCYHIFFKDLLSVIRPKAVFLVCYYYIAAMALIRACRELGILTIEIQHALQGKYHKEYACWTRIPEGGYELLPDFFWVWSEQCQRDIMETRPLSLANQNKHLPLVGGYTWLGKWLKEDLGLGQREKHFLGKLEKYQKVVLVSFQDFSRLPSLLNSLVPAMKHKNNSWFWLLRFHPLHKSNQEVNFVLDRLSIAKIANFDIPMATEVPLYSLLKRCHYHITESSTVCYEATAFGVKTGIIGLTGYMCYQDGIERGEFDYISQTGDILTNIESSCKRSVNLSLSDSYSYIDARPELAHKALNYILNLRSA